MIDVRLLREEFETVAAALGRRGVDRADLEHLAGLDARRRELIAEGDRLRAEQKQAGKRIGQAESDEERQRLIAESKEASARVDELEAEQERIQAELDERLAHLPNLPHPDAPEGFEEEDAVELRTFGERAAYDVTPRDHVDVGEALGALDIERAVKAAGTRNALLRGDGVMLEFALVRFALDRLVGLGHTPVAPPMLVREEALYGTGFLPGTEDELYEVAKDERYLAGTSEVPIAAMHLDEILDTSGLPLRYAGFSTCFRREAGAHGKETRGLIRVHQFDKVEMFSFTTPEQSEAEHQRLLDIELDLLTDLGLSGRVVDIAVGDLGASAQRKFDCEAWFPGRERHIELTSCSNCTDFQARRLRCRHRHDPQGDTELVHTLNGTAVAVGRTIAALLETHQRADGTVAVPEVLQPYLGRDHLAPWLG
jgi:seryl-tRNA synthetase